MVSYESLQDYVKGIEGKPLYTLARRRKFTARCGDDGLEYIPTSTGKPRRESRSVVERVLERYNRTGSLSPGDYQDITANASYLMALTATLVSYDNLRQPK